MNVIRKIYERIPDSIPIPDSLKNRRIEVIFLPLEEEKKGLGTISIEEFAGKWQGEPLIRPEQGNYEERLNLP